MVDLVFWGWSDIVRRRALLATRRIQRIHNLYVVVDSQVYEVRRSVLTEDVRGSLSRKPLWHISSLLERPEKGIVYVSGINTVHGPRAIAALEAGWHVVVDKPGFVLRSDLQRASALAVAHSRLLREAIVWDHHEQVRQLARVLRSQDLIPEVLLGNFCIPGFDSDNFRNSLESGGGACWDLGPYAVTAAQPFGLDGFKIESSHLLQESGAQLPDSGFVVAATVGAGSTFVGTFSHKSSYLNQLVLLGRDFRAELRPAFSSRADLSIRVSLEVANEDQSFVVKPSDSFENFLKACVNAVEQGDVLSGVSAINRSTSQILELRHTLGLS